VLTVSESSTHGISRAVLRAVRWLDDSTYTAVEPGPNGKGTQLVEVDAASGRKTTLAAGEALITAGGKDTIGIEDYDWNSAHSKLVIFTTAPRVWRENTRGDFWVFDVASKKLHQLGGAGREVPGRRR